MSNNIHTLPLSSGQPPSPPPQQQQIVQQQSLVSLDAIKAKLFNIPPATKILLFLNAAFGIMGFFVQESDMNLAFNPGYFFSKPWTIVTSLFYDSSFLNTILNCFILVFIGNFFEYAWGSTELLRFSAVVGGLSNLICGFILVLVGLSSQAVKYEYNLCGFSPVLMGFAVGFKQFYPDKEQSLFGTVKFTLNMLPLIMLGVSLFFGLFSMFKPFLQGVVALFVSWVYLRFYQKKPGGVVGDRSPGFAFHTMFPAVLHPFLTKLESIVGGLLRIRNSEQQQQPGQPQTEMMLPVSVQDTRQELYPEQQHAPQETGRQKYGSGHTLGE